jgi:hypothetical protein
MKSLKSVWCTVQQNPIFISFHLVPLHSIIFYGSDQSLKIGDVKYILVRVLFFNWGRAKTTLNKLCISFVLSQIVIPTSHQSKDLGQILNLSKHSSVHNSSHTNLQSCSRTHSPILLRRKNTVRCSIRVHQ